MLFVVFDHYFIENSTPLQTISLIKSTSDLIVRVKNLYHKLCTMYINLISTTPFVKSWALVQFLA